jgi:hypothetical protein
MDVQNRDRGHGLFLTKRLRRNNRIRLAINNGIDQEKKTEVGTA